MLAVGVHVVLGHAVERVANELLLVHGAQVVDHDDELFHRHLRIATTLRKFEDAGEEDCTARRRQHLDEQTSGRETETTSRALHPPEADRMWWLSTHIHAANCGSVR